MQQVGGWHVFQAAHQQMPRENERRDETKLQKEGKDYRRQTGRFTSTSSKLMEEHGVKDEAERPGITGSKAEARLKPRTEVEPAVVAQPSGDPSAGDDTPSAHQGTSSSKPAPSPPWASSSNQGTRAQKRSLAEPRVEQKEKKIKKQGDTKRTAEEEGDDAERDDRNSWRNYIEPASSNAAPESKGTKRETKEEE